MKYFFPGLSVRHPLALVALLGPFAQAQDFHWGVHFGAISPQGDLGKAVGQSPGLGEW